MPKFYFAHQTPCRKQAREIELKIEESTGLILDNPFYDGDAKEVKSLDGSGVSNLHESEIVGTDLRKVMISDGIVSVILEDILAIGTCMEIAIASHSWGKPCYIISPMEKVREHPFIKYFGIRVFENHYAFIKFAQDAFPEVKSFVEEQKKRARRKEKKKWKLFQSWTK